MSALLPASMLLFGGSYQLDAAASTVEDPATTLESDLSIMTATTFLLSQRRLDYAFSIAFPAMTDELKRDMSYAFMHTEIAPDYEYAVAGVANGVTSSLHEALGTALSGLSASRRQTYLWIVEQMVYHAALVTSSHGALARASAYEVFRGERDGALSYLFGDIEQASKVRGLADDIEKHSMQALALGAKEAIDKKSHELSMQQVAWERDKRMDQYKKASSAARGSLLGNIVGGMADGFIDAKASAGNIA